MMIAQITDFHVAADPAAARDSFDTAAALRAAVEHVNELLPQPDVVLATGDLAAEGTPEDYAVVAEALSRLDMPVYVIPGNHDIRENLRAAFADHAYLPNDGEFLQYTIEDYPLRLIALDTLVPGAEGGLLSEDRLDWLDQRLAEAPERPTLILMHHPPFTAHIPFFDAIACQGAEAFGEIVARNPQIQAIVCGHIHRPIEARRFGSLILTAPSTGYQYPLAMHEDSVMERVYEPPACRIYRWSEEFGFVAHLSYIGDYRQAPA